MHFQEECCVICKLGFENEESVSVFKKGVLTLIDYCEKRERLEVGTYLAQCISKTHIGRVLVHKNCRRNFTDQRRLIYSCAEDVAEPCAKRLRSSLLPFNWKEDCMLSEKSTMVDTRHPEKEVHLVTTLPLCGSFLRVVTKGGIYGHLKSRIIFTDVLI